jgi:DNA polymerase I
VDIGELVITKRLSKRPSEYTHSVMQAIAAKQLEKAGYDVHPGQTISYVVTNSGSHKPYEKVTALPLIKEKTRYDRNAYMQMLVSAAETLFNVFGYTEKELWEIIHGEVQTKLQVA